MAPQRRRPLGIDPRVDIVFRDLFGSPEHEKILLSFLNAVLAPEVPIVKATTLSPRQAARALDQKGVFVDIQAEDQRGHRFHVEMQRQAHRGLDQRILYSWARLYAARLRRGGDYPDLRPVISVWICDENVFPDSRSAHLQFAVTETQAGLKLHPDLRIDILQLAQARAGEPVAAAEGDWFRFFNEASQWRSAPESIQDAGIQEAVTVLEHYHDDAGLRALYEARLNAERLERARQREAAEVKAALADARAELRQVRRERKKDLAEAKKAQIEKDRAEAEKAQAEAEKAQAEAEKAQAEATAERERLAKEAALAELAQLRSRLAPR